MKCKYAAEAAKTLESMKAGAEEESEEGVEVPGEEALEKKDTVDEERNLGASSRSGAEKERE